MMSYINSERYEAAQEAAEKAVKEATQATASYSTASGYGSFQNCPNLTITFR